MTDLITQRNEKSTTYYLDMYAFGSYSAGQFQRKVFKQLSNGKIMFYIFFLRFEIYWIRKSVTKDFIDSSSYEWSQKTPELHLFLYCFNKTSCWDEENQLPVKDSNYIFDTASHDSVETDDTVSDCNQLNPWKII